MQLLLLKLKKTLKLYPEFLVTEHFASVTTRSGLGQAIISPELKGKMGQELEVKCRTKKNPAGDVIPLKCRQVFPNSLDWVGVCLCRFEEDAMGDICRQVVKDPREEAGAAVDVGRLVEAVRHGVHFAPQLFVVAFWVPDHVGQEAGSFSLTTGLALLAVVGLELKLSSEGNSGDFFKFLLQ